MNSQPEAVQRVEKIAGVSIPLYDMDVCDKEKLSAVFSKRYIDGVTHFAG